MNVIESVGAERTGFRPSHGHDCAQSSANMRPQTSVPLHGTHCLKTCAPW